MAVAKKIKKDNSEISCLCLCCGTQTPTSFYMSRDNFNSTGKLFYCKDCIRDKLYPYFVKICPTENIAFHHLLRSLNVPYIQDVYNMALANIKNPNSKINNVNDNDTSAIVSAYFAKYNSLHDKNGYGNTYLDSVGLDKIDGLETFDDIVKVKHERKLKESATGEYDIVEYDVDYLIHKYGHLPVEDLAFLEEEYLQWEDKLGKFINDQSLRMNVIMLCNEYLKIRKKNENGDDAKDEISTIQNIMRTSGLVEKINQNEQTLESVGMEAEKIEKTRPIKPVDTALEDVDGYHDMLLGLAGATSRALGKTNQYTAAFDKIMGEYSLDIFNQIDNEKQEVDSGE